MAPVVPFLPLIGTVVGAGITAATTIYTSNKANKQAEAAQKRQEEYYNEIKNQQAATEAEEQRITQETQERQRQYAAGLLDSSTGLDNMLSGGYKEDVLGGTSLLGSSLRGNVSSMFA